MKFVILAAGMGTRLSPLTDNKPKCMVEFKKKPIIDYIIENALTCGIQEEDIVVIGGYKFDVLQAHLKKYSRITFVENSIYDITNMVYTLFEYHSQGEIIISYADIIYTEEALTRALSHKGDGIVVDMNWQEIWGMRFGIDNLMEDAETLKMNADGSVKELGKKPTCIEDIEAQYTGIIKIQNYENATRHYRALELSMDEKKHRNLYMTDFLQSLIDNSILSFDAIKIEGGFLEIDSKEDLDVLETHVEWI